MKKYLNLTESTFKNKEIAISGSKSESNRLLILNAFYPNIALENLSNSKDTQVLLNALSTKSNTINIGHAGTAMRFLTAYFASKKGSTITLTGSKRMQQRPVKILVDALNQLGAEIIYLNKAGFPPLKISGKELKNNKISIAGNISSQYITALLLIAPTLKNGLEVTLIDKITSKPYINMTLELLTNLGIKWNWTDNTIKITPKKSVKNKTITVESDWSSASYFYSLVALSEGISVTLNTFFQKSKQGDSKIVDIYKNFGVTTTFKNNSITLKKDKNFLQKKHVLFNFENTPDLAQTVAVTCVGLGVSCGITGLQTLKIKETDRLFALKTELQKLGAKVRITDESIHIKSTELKKDKTITTYDDHRMAMAFAPLALKIPLYIQNPDVVEKSYPNFWNDLALLNLK